MSSSSGAMDSDREELGGGVSSQHTAHTTSMTTTIATSLPLPRTPLVPAAGGGGGGAATGGGGTGGVDRPNSPGGLSGEMVQMSVDQANTHLLEATLQQLDESRRKYETVVEKYGAVHNQLKVVEAQKDQYKQQNIEFMKLHSAAVRERDSMKQERDAMKQQCTTAIKKWDSVLREKKEVDVQLSRVKNQREEAVKEIMAEKLRYERDIGKMKDERNAAIQEYRLIMSERDSVHKEIEKLQDELNESHKALKEGETEQRAAQQEVELLRREIIAALHDRDKSLKECNDLREKYGDFVNAKEEAEHLVQKVQDQANMFKMERDVARKERTSRSIERRIKRKLKKATAAVKPTLLEGNSMHSSLNCKKRNTRRRWRTVDGTSRSTSGTRSCWSASPSARCATSFAGRGTAQCPTWPRPCANATMLAARRPTP